MRFPVFPIALVCVVAVGCAAHKGRESAVTTQPAGLVAIEQVIPFATADAVRIQVKLAATAPSSGVELTAKIAPLTKGKTLWTGPIAIVDAAPNAPTTAERRVTGLKPRLWEPTAPNL